MIGVETVSGLLHRGHTVRIVSRNAVEDAKRWPEGVEPWAASVADGPGVQGSALGCDAVLHIAGIARERPPDETFERVNVQGTRNIADEAVRSGVRRLVYVSSLGAERGSSEYHRSKRAGEAIVRDFPEEWIIVRPGNVYGPGDEVLSLLLEWVRTSPVVPVIGSGEDLFQPVWSGDVAAALIAVLERGEIANTVLEVAGPDRTTLDDLIDRMVVLTGRSPVRVPLPAFAVAAGIRAASAVGLELPVGDAELRMLLEGNVISDPAGNALTGVLDLVPTPLDEGLRRLATSTPEQLPSEGFGPMQMRVFGAEVTGAVTTPGELITKLREDFARLMPGIVELSAEPGSATRLDEGATLTMSLPVRGHIQVRVAEVTDTDVTLLTLRGHPLAGAVRFRAGTRNGSLRFEVQVLERAASLTDFALMALGGNVLQGRTWEDFVRNVLAETGTVPEEVSSATVALDDGQAKRIETWLRGLVDRGGRGRGTEGATVGRASG